MENSRETIITGRGGGGKWATKCEASLAQREEAAADGGLLVNIEYLVSYLGGRNVSEKKEVRAKLPLYRISQSW